ncbi:flagellar motor protein MotB [Aliidiomarina sanyensis]|uniref:Motility protein MotB n=1 Tax=Aliidiomarina sanyensis TaxID=1249555 RepID=A0A432WPV1_9GAMM|nr:flagellar motor protein MotB [Aliidiomarina sanyensis]RUO35805.1 motility protein MotB [Aliidiomarina sanyensis]
MAEEHRPIIIRRKKVVKKHHGGSWKIALADFMTALMALFLVMWIISMAGDDARESIAEYFRTPLVVAMTGGDRATASTSAIRGGGPDPMHMEGERARIDLRRETRPSDVRRHFQNIQRQIEQAIEADPELRALQSQMRFDMTREGLRIQLLDSEQRPMFQLGSTTVAPYMSRLLRTVAPLLNQVPNEVTITGHTDSIPFSGGDAGYSNWELSADRANASRRELIAGGFEPSRLISVAGVADRVPLEGADPRDPMNRRITLVLHTTVSAEFIRRQGLFPGDAEEFERLLQQDREIQQIIDSGELPERFFEQDDSDSDSD